jgi:hypothetical protein
VLFSEPAAWEAIGDHCRDGRYEQICKIHRAKYGDCVRDLLSTEAGELSLYGDRLAGPTIRTRGMEN